MNLLETKDTKAPAIISATKQRHTKIHPSLKHTKKYSNQISTQSTQNNMRINSSNFQCFQLILNRFSTGTVSYKIHLTNLETS